MASKKPNNFLNKKKIQRIQQMQELAKNYMIGGFALPLWKGNGKSREISIDYFAIHLDLYRLSKRNDSSLEDVTYHPIDLAVLEAMFSIRHKWTLGMGVLCRNKQGKVYFVQQQYLVVHTQCDWEQIQEHLQEHASKAFFNANPDYRLAVCYCYVPHHEHEINDVHFNAMTYVRNVLGKVCTRWESMNLQEVPYFKAETQSKYEDWFYHQKERGTNAVAKVRDMRSFYQLNEKGTEHYNQKGQLAQLHPAEELVPERYQIVGSKNNVRLEIQTETDLKFYRDLLSNKQKSKQ